MTANGEACRIMIMQGLIEYDLPDQEEAVQLLCMIAAHESGRFHFVRPMGRPGFIVISD